jgi:hypothetical protein
MLAVLAGCSKQEQSDAQAIPEAAPEAVPEADQAEAAAVQEDAPALEIAPSEYADNPLVTSDLSSVSEHLQNQDYDTAVANLLMVNMAPKNEAQQQAYRDQMYYTLEYLRQRAEQDARAQEAYQKLGRGLMGR